MTSQERAFREFSDFTAKLKGDEKSEARTFLFHLLAGFGPEPNSLLENSAIERPGIGRLERRNLKG